MKRLKVCLLLEGTYPYITGGVSAWVQDLIQGLPEIDFALLTISPVSPQPLRYTLPPNVVEHVDVDLSAPSPQTSLGKHAANVLAAVEAAHDQFSFDNFTAMIRRLPEGVNLHQASLKADTSWKLILEKNRQTNPAWPFSEFFWAHQSAHEMLFKVLAAVPPQADLYHAISTGFAGLVGLAAKIRRGLPFLLTEHGLYHKERQMEIRRATYLKGRQRDLWISLYNQLSEQCYRGADAVTALFEEYRQEQIAGGARPEVCQVIPNGIDLARFGQVTRQPRPGRHIGLIGRVVPIKDTKTFIITARAILDQMPDTRFYVVGPTDEDPDYFADCQALAQTLGLTGHLEFTGAQDVRKYYSFLDVLVLTSVREAQPLVILEGWAAGVPTVASKVGNVPEMLDYDPALLADPKDTAGLAARIVALLRDPAALAAAGARGLLKTREIYSRERLLEAFRQLYQNTGRHS